MIDKDESLNDGKDDINEDGDGDIIDNINEWKIESNVDEININNNDDIDIDDVKDCKIIFYIIYIIYM